MAIQHVVYESRAEYDFKRTIRFTFLWVIPIFCILYGLNFLKGDIEYLKTLVIGIIWLGLVIYFKFYFGKDKKKNKKKAK